MKRGQQIFSNKLNASTVSQIHAVQNLGIVFNFSLTFETHIKYIAPQLPSSTCFIQMADIQNRLILHFSLAYQSQQSKISVFFHVVVLTQHKLTRMCGRMLWLSQ